MLQRTKNIVQDFIFWSRIRLSPKLTKNQFHHNTHPFSHKKETRAFKPLRFYGSNHLSPTLTKNQVTPHFSAEPKASPLSPFYRCFWGLLSVNRNDRFLRIVLYTTLYTFVYVCKPDTLLLYTPFSKRGVSVYTLSAFCCLMRNAE